MKFLRVTWLCHAVLVLAFTVSVQAQSTASLSGCIEDSTHAAIQGATVVLTGSDSSKRYQAQSDEKGCFTLTGVENGGYHLHLLAEAFAPFERAVDIRNNIEIDTAVLQIQPLRNSIVVTATRTPTPSMALGASVDVIDRTDIEASEARQTIDLLRGVTGMAVMRSGDIGGITSLFTRGGESDYTKILVDGIPVNQPGGAYDISHLETDNVNRVEIVRGPQSAVFGSDAITGVVQVFTQPGSGPPEFEYSAEGGSFATTDQRGSIRGAWKKFDFSNSFSRFDTDNIGRNNDYRNASYFGNLGFTANSRQSVRVTLLNSSVAAGTPGANAPGFTSFGPNNRMTRLERAAGVTYRALIGPRLTQHVAYRLYDHDQYFYSAFGISNLLHTRHRFEYHGDVNLPAAGTFSYGVDYDRENATVAAARHFRNDYGYYVQQQFEAFRRLNVTAGIRIEDNTTYGTAATPRVAVSYRLSPSTRIRFSAGTGIKEPNFIENFSTSPYFRGNPDLAAERSRSWEAGAEQSFLDDRVTADLTWFDNRFRNVIELVSNPDFTARYENIGRSLARGTELRLRARVRRMNAQVNYTYLDGHVEESMQTSFPFRPGDPLLRRPRHSGDFSLTWTESKWTAHWSSRFVGRRADSDFYAFDPPNSLTNNDAYSTSDAAVTYEVNRFLSAYARFENIFDHSYQEVLGYLALGRSAGVGVRVRVKGER
jgi:vitamin B12 transporter